MDEEEAQAREALVLSLFDGFRNTGDVTRSVTQLYVDLTAKFSMEAVGRSVTQFTTVGVAGRNSNFAPSSAEFYQNVEMWEQAMDTLRRHREERPQLVAYPIGGEPPPPTKPLGPLSVDFGQGVIDMRDMTPSQKEAVLQNKGRVAEIEAIAGRVRAKLGSF